MQDIDNSLEKAQRLLDEMAKAQQEHDSSPFEYKDILPDWLQTFQRLVDAGLASQAVLDTLQDDREPGPRRNRVFVEMHNQARLVALEQRGETGDIVEPGQIQEDTLTPREKEVAHCLAQGLNDKQIAERLFISAGTVKKHRQKIKPKWVVSTEDIKALQDEARRRGYERG